MERLPVGLHEKVPELVRISRSLRRDRELAVYESEDAESALAGARFVHAEVSKAMGAEANHVP